jgi:hypothetical protein
VAAAEAACAAATAFGQQMGLLLPAQTEVVLSAAVDQQVAALDAVAVSQQAGELVIPDSEEEGW